MTIPETRLFDNWTQRSLCIELTFFIYVFSVFALLLFVALPFFLVFVVVVVFLLSCLLDFSAFVVGVLCDCCVTFRFCVCVSLCCFASVVLSFSCALSGFLCSSFVFRVRVVFGEGLKN